MQAWKDAICLEAEEKVPDEKNGPAPGAKLEIEGNSIDKMALTYEDMVKQKIDIHPTKWGKLTTTFQMSAAISVLLQLTFSYIFWWAAVFFTLVSGMDYVKRGFQALYASDNSRNTH